MSSIIEEFVEKLANSLIKLHNLSDALESTIQDPVERELAAVLIRRRFLEIPPDLSVTGFPYHTAAGACCENMVGFVGIPVGIAGPLLADGSPYKIPLATTEGALVASTNRGCKAILESGGPGVTTVVTGKGMARGPFIKLASLTHAAQVKEWVDSHYDDLCEVFCSTSRYIKLTRVRTALAGRYLFIRFSADTGEAMGMNMVSKATEKAVAYIVSAANLSESVRVCLSSNFCTDKKAGSAVNWIDGRGYSVIAEARITDKALRDVLKVGSAVEFAELAQAKNFVGSSLAGVAAGGQNAHAANLVAALFLACGQDPAQVVESAACLTQCEAQPDGSLVISCTMPCIEVGVVGGGTRLPSQHALTDMLTGGFSEGKRAEGLARLVCATVLAGELSLLSALCSGSLVSSHLQLNRKT